VKNKQSISPPQPYGTGIIYLQNTDAHMCHLIHFGRRICTYGGPNDATI